MTNSTTFENKLHWCFVRKAQWLEHHSESQRIETRQERQTFSVITDANIALTLPQGYLQLAHVREQLFACGVKRLVPFNPGTAGF